MKPPNGPCSIPRRMLRITDLIFFSRLMKEPRVAVRIRLKRMGRRHRPFFRVCAIDGRAPRDGKVIEELGYYDPILPETDARAVLNGPRIDHWIGVGAQPSDKVAVLIKKYGTSGTHLDAQAAALERLANARPTAPPPMVVAAPAPPEEPVAEEAVAEEAVAPEASAPEAAAPEAAADATAEAEPAAEAAPETESGEAKDKS